jgi:hypothetical protein
MQNDGRLLTFDYKIEAIAPQGSPARAALEILRI